MSLFSGSNISELFVGESKIGSVFVGENCVYQSKREVKPEPYLPNEYFYFKAYDNEAKVSFSEQTAIYKDTNSTTTPTIDKTKFTNYVTPTLEYSYDKKTWNNYVLNTVITLKKGVNPVVYFRGNNNKPWYDRYDTSYDETSGDTTTTRIHEHYIWFHANTIEGQVKSGGNVLSLRDKTLSDITTTICDYAFSGLFYNCSNLLTAPVLSATTLTNCCYGGNSVSDNVTESTLKFYYLGMFSSCSSLIQAPELPATTLIENCYKHMFNGCKSFKQTPELPATILADHCYNNMFTNCTSLTQVSELSATVLAEYCYYNMFNNCTSLTQAPELPATTLVKSCYSNMFSNCFSLVKTHILSATKLAEYCYTSMFSNCSSLIKAPELPATNLAESCYSHMFDNCTSLTQAPELPATTLVRSCYTGMFNNCTSLENAPNLPATKLAEYCYGSSLMYINSLYGEGMFSNCTALKKPPIISATTLAEGCFAGMFAKSGLTETPPLKYTTLAANCYGGSFIAGMFQGCQSLTKISILPATTITDGAYGNMFANSNVKASATQTTECKYAYRVPTSGTGSTASKSLAGMFTDASDTTNTFTPSVNTTFYINVPSF